MFSLFVAIATVTGVETCLIVVFHWLGRSPQVAYLVWCLCRDYEHFNGGSLQSDSHGLHSLISLAPPHSAAVLTGMGCCDAQGPWQYSHTPEMCQKLHILLQSLSPGSPTRTILATWNRTHDLKLARQKLWQSKEMLPLHVFLNFSWHWSLQVPYPLYCLSGPQFILLAPSLRFSR